MRAAFVELPSFQRHLADHLDEEAGSQFWMFLVYDKGKVADLDAAQRRVFRKYLKAELIARTNA